MTINLKDLGAKQAAIRARHIADNSWVPDSIHIDGHTQTIHKDRGELLDMVEGWQSELMEVESDWMGRFREQAIQWEQRTKLIRKQLETVIEMAAKGRALTPPTIIMKEPPHE